MLFQKVNTTQVSVVTPNTWPYLDARQIETDRYNGREDIRQAETFVHANLQRHHGETLVVRTRWNKADISVYRQVISDVFGNYRKRLSGTWCLHSMRLRTRFDHGQYLFY